MFHRSQDYRNIQEYKSHSEDLNVKKKKLFESYFQYSKNSTRGPYPQWDEDKADCIFECLQRKCYARYTDKEGS